MEQHVGKEGAYVWIYEPNGVKVLSAHQVRQMEGNDFTELPRRSMAGLTGRILDCFAGSQKWGIPVGPNRRRVVEERLRQVRARNALDVALKHRR
jgi:hypothetical protein